MAVEDKRGLIALQGDNLLVRFSYDKRRFEKIRRLNGAFYDKENRQWVVPLRHLSTLERSAMFCREAVRYGFDQAAAALLVADQDKRLQQAQARHRQDPFCVAEQDIAMLDLDVVFRLDRPGRSLRAHIKSGSRTKKLFNTIPGAHYLKSEHGLFFPTDQLVEFIRLLREKGGSFAVADSAGVRLKQTAEKRAAIVCGRRAPTAADLQQCLLAPYVFMPKTGTFVMHGCTSKHLQDCFPKGRSFHERRHCAHSMDLAALERMLLTAEGSATKVWLAAEVLEEFRAGHNHVLHKSAQDGGIAENTSAAREPLWDCDARGRGGLVVARELAQRLVGAGTLASLEEAVFHPHIPDRIFIPFRDSKISQSREKIDTLLQQWELGSPHCSGSFQALLLELARRSELLARQADYHALKDCSVEMPDGELAGKLFPHQRVAVRWLTSCPEALLGDEMGLGKTLSVLAAFYSLKVRGEADFILVICPNSLTRNWQREAKRWIQGSNFLLLPEKKREREQFLGALAANQYSQCDGVAVNYESFRLSEVYPAFAELAKKKRVILCVDESQRAKNPTSKIFRSLRYIAPLCRRRILLSGTPTPKDITDIWAQMFILDGGQRFGSNYYDWLAEVAEIGTRWSRIGIKRFVPQGVDEAVLRVHELLLRRRKEQVINLPDKLYSIRDIELKGDQRKRYDEVCKELLVRITASDGETFVRQIESILEEYLRAVQVASNPRLVDEAWSGEPAKFIELDEIVQEVVAGQERKLVIWTNYLKNIDELTARYTAFNARPFSGKIAVQERAKIVNDFQSAGPISPKILVAVPAAGGVGITLTAAQTAIYIDKTWNAEHWFQSTDRIHRIGQTGTVNIISLHAGRVDELIARNLARKGRDQARLLGDVGNSLQQGRYPSRAELLAALSNSKIP